LEANPVNQCRKLTLMISRLSGKLTMKFRRAIPVGVSDARRSALSDCHFGFADVDRMLYNRLIGKSVWDLCCVLPLWNGDPRIESRWELFPAGHNQRPGACYGKGIVEFRSDPQQNNTARRDGGR